MTAALLKKRPLPARSKRGSTTAAWRRAAKPQKRSVEGPGTGSASSKMPAAMRAGKNGVVHSSGKTMSRAPFSAASSARASALARVSSRSPRQANWTAAALYDRSMSCLSSFPVRSGRGAVTPHPVAPGLLGLVKRLVGAVDELLHRHPVLAAEEGEPHRDGLGERPRPGGERLAAELGAQLFGDGLRVPLGPHAVEQGDELLPAVAPDGVELAQRRSDAPGGLAQDLVPHRVPMFIVHFLEMVKVHQQERERLLLRVPLHAADLLLQPG